MRSLDSHGGWISTASDLIRFALAIDGKRGTALLKPETVKVMDTTIRPKALSADAGNVEDAHGLAFDTVASGDGWEWSHAGALEGSNCSWLFRSADGTTISFVFNTLPVDYGAFFGDIIPALQAELAATTSWPTTDLFVKPDRFEKNNPGVLVMFRKPSNMRPVTRRQINASIPLLAATLVSGIALTGVPDSVQHVMSASQDVATPATNPIQSHPR
jgi:hypothetical protein